MVPSVPSLKNIGGNMVVKLKLKENTYLKGTQSL